MLDDSIRNRFDAEQDLKVVTAQFKGVEPFNWNIFSGFDRMRVLTYSASAQMIVRMLDRYSFTFFECVFGYEGGLQQVAEIVAFQQLQIDQVWDYVLQLEDKRKRVIFERIQAGRARFYVVKDNIAHAKIYLLETDRGERRRVVVGSANFSERAFGGKQSETLVVFDNDAQAWEHYLREYDAIKETSTDRFDMSAYLQAAEIGYHTDHTYTEKRRDVEEAIPRRAELKVPILKLLEYEDLTQSELEERLSALYHLTVEERNYRPYEKNNNTLFYNEIWGAKDQLKREGLIVFGHGLPARITTQGRAELK